jgi:hypothetical protein
MDIAPLTSLSVVVFGSLVVSNRLKLSCPVVACFTAEVLERAVTLGRSIAEVFVPIPDLERPNASVVKEPRLALGLMGTSERSGGWGDCLLAVAFAGFDSGLE